MKNAKNCDNSLMKKMIFLIFLIVFLVIVQIFSSNVNRIVTFHPKNEREIISWIGKTYHILDGNRDETIGSSPKAIYKITLQTGIHYIVLGREKNSTRDYLLLLDPGNLTIEHKLPISPYFFKVFDSTDYRGLVDLNNDKNLEFVCVVNGKMGKRIKIVKVSAQGLLDLQFPFIEEYEQIRMDDFNIDGTMDFACYTLENGILQVPSVFKLDGFVVKKQKLKAFPGLIHDFESYWNRLKKRTEKAGNPVIGYDLNVTKAKMLLTLHLEKEFDALFVLMDQKNSESDIAQKMRLFRMRILKSYFSLEKGDILFATQQIEQALDFMYGSTFPPKKKESMVLVEKASYHLWADQWDVAKEEIRKALELDPNNTISQQIYLKMGSP